jgi:hypothetical protein
MLPNGWQIFATPLSSRIFPRTTLYRCRAGPSAHQGSTFCRAATLKTCGSAGLPALRILGSTHGVPWKYGQVIKEPASAKPTARQALAHQFTLQIQSQLIRFDPAERFCVQLCTVLL